MTHFAVFALLLAFLVAGASADIKIFCASPTQRWSCATGSDVGTECNWKPSTGRERTVTLPGCSEGPPAGFREVVNDFGMCPDPYPDQQGQWGECRPRG